MENEHPPQSHLPTNAPTTRGIPRLRISHLLLWTLCSAVYLTLLQDWRANALSGNSDSGRDITDLLSGITSGTAIAGLIILVLSKLKTGTPLIKEPGHWLIAGQAIITLAWVPYVVRGLFESDFNNVMLLFYLCLLFVSAIAYFLAIWQCPSFHWKLFFAVLLLLTLLKLFTYIALVTEAFEFSAFGLLHTVYTLGDIALCLLLLPVIAFDKKRKARRDWLHWTGVVTFFVNQCVTFIRMM